MTTNGVTLRSRIGFFLKLNNSYRVNHRNTNVHAVPQGQWDRPMTHIAGRHCSIYFDRECLWNYDHTRSNANNSTKGKHTGIWTYGLFDQGQRNRVIDVIQYKRNTVHRDSIIWNEMRSRLWTRTRLSTTNTTKVKHRNTHVLSVRSGPTKSLHRFDQDNKRTPAIAIVVYFDKHYNGEIRTADCIKIRIAPWKPSTRQYKRTFCSSTANEIVPSMQPR